MKIRRLTPITGLFAIYTLLLTFGPIANAGNLSSVQKCVDHGYQAMGNRHAIVAAVLDATDSKIMIFGAAKENQIFEIGSITKTFTGNLLAQAVAAGSIKLSDPIPTAYQKSGSVISFQNLTTHTSGIIAGNFPKFIPANPLNPYGGLTIPIFKTLYAGTALNFQPGTDWSYSNIGESLLGLILGENSGNSYENMVVNKIFKVLGMNDSSFQVSESSLSRFPEGRMIDQQSGQMQVMPHWNQSATNPAGGISSTIADMVLYARANLSPQLSPLAESVNLSQQQLYYIQSLKMWIGMNWIIQPDIGLVWHNGETFGFNSILAISKKNGQAIIAMTDTTILLTDSKGNHSFDTSLQNVAFNCLK